MAIIVHHSGTTPTREIVIVSQSDVNVTQEIIIVCPSNAIVSRARVIVFAQTAMQRYLVPLISIPGQIISNTTGVKDQLAVFSQNSM